MTSIVRGSLVEPTPWANGQGTTRELWVSPAGVRPRWRLSMARVEGSGEFSVLPGVSRSLMLVDGQVLLSFDGAEPVALTGPCTFDGATPVRYEASRPSEDLGVMVWDGPPAELVVRVVEEPFTLRPDTHRAAVMLGGSAVLADERLEVRDVVVLDAEGSQAVTLEPVGRALVVLVGA